MNQIVFFIINGKELVLDKVLVEFNEDPIFFVCKSGENYFIALCTDIDNKRYLVSKINLGGLSKMLRGKITMRNLILQSTNFWRISLGDDFSRDVVSEIGKDVLVMDDLPYEGAFLTLATEDLRRYAEKIDSLLYRKEGWERESQQILDQCLEFILKPFYESYEVILKNLYESIFEIQVNLNEFSQDVKIDSEDEFPLAA